MNDRGHWCLGLSCLFMLALGLGRAAVSAADQPQWGQRFSRNMVSDETGLPAEFDLESGKHLKWKVPLGSETWSSPIVAQGKVFVGTNNEVPRNPVRKGDRGIMLCLDEKTGDLDWQLVTPKILGSNFYDWPRAGICSPATVEGQYVYTVTNRGEALCMDIRGLHNGNDGLYRDEAQRMALNGDPLYELSPTDADIVWLFDIIKQAGTYPHDGAHSSILIDGDFLYMNTNNGVDETHKVVRKPDGPSLIVLDKGSGRLLARDVEGIGPNIFHSTWSSPAMGVVNGKKLVFFAGGDGVIYAFEALQSAPPQGQVDALKRVWRFDCDPDAPKEDVRQYQRNRKVSPSNIKSMPVFHNDRVYVTVGGDIWWGKNQAWLQCIDATGTGDITRTGLLWSQPLNKHSCSTPAIQAGLAYAADCGGAVTCFDADTGKPYWVHENLGELWASPLVADGKIYIGSRRRDFCILQAGQEKKVLYETRLDSAIAGTACVANGVLYISSMNYLYAIAQ